MSVKKGRFLKVKRISRKKIFVVLILIISLVMIPILSNIDINQNLHVLNDEQNKNNNLFKENLKTQDLASDNTFTGIGAPWNVTHYANGTKLNLAVSFTNSTSYDNSHSVELYGWDGYQLNSTIKNLYDTRNWINGTFHCGDFAYPHSPGGDGTPANDSYYVYDWTFKDGDIEGYNNPMSGNYLDADHLDSDGHDCLQLAIDANSGRYDVGDKCWWETVINTDRGEVDEAWLSFSVRGYSADEYNNHMVLQAVVNNKVIWGMGLASILEVSGNPDVGDWGDWYNPYPIYIDGDDTEVFPDGFKSMNVALEFKRVSGTASSYGDHSLLFDNVSLIVKSKAKPTQLELYLNNTKIKDNANYGEGFVGMLGNWNGSKLSSVHTNFSSNLNWPFTFEEDNTEISYKIEFETDLTLYVNKTTPESYYTADPDLSYQGSAFVVSNNSKTNWTTYAHMEIPTGYEETNMTLEYPSDYNLTGVFFSLNPDSLEDTNIKKYGDKKVVNIPVSSITSNTNGFWKITAEAPNYCSEMSIYKNTTIALDNWELNNIFLSGDYINITAKINNSLLISGYIQDTNAQLQIKFPNGSIWTTENQLKEVKSTGMVHFDPIEVPSAGVNYKVGPYQAIVTWNNSYSNFDLNETGIIYKSFSVIHNSSLQAVVDYFPDVFEGDEVNLRVIFTDLVNNKPIEGAIVSLKNFTGGTQYFEDLDDGDYLLVFNTSGGVPGNNTITINATHSSYEKDQVNITIEVIYHTNLIAEEFPSIEVPWNNSFSIHLNYTFTNETGNYGIEGANPTVTWNDDKSVESGDELYNYVVTCNTSKYQVNTAPNLRIDFDEIGYESQTIIISIELVERDTYITNIFINGDNCTTNKTANIHSGENLNITVQYKDNDAGGTLIHDAFVTLNGTGIGEVFDDYNNFYNLTFNSTKLDTGIIFINIIAQKDNYTAKTEKITINVYERETDYWVYLNGIEFEKGENPSIKLYKNQVLNVTFTYNDTILKEHIPGATVDINGSNVSELLEDKFNNYSVEIDTNDLNQGVNFLTLFARKDGYEAYSILIVVEIIQIETDLILFVNGTDITTDPSITRYPSQILNITVSYNSSNPVSHIPGATVDINGSDVSEILEDKFNNYSVLIDTDDLNQGANFLSIFARKDGYEPQSILLIIEIIQIETDLTLFVNGTDITADPSITRYPSQILNITVSYDSSNPVSHISGATVDINGSDVSKVLEDKFNNYSVLIDTDDLNQGVNFLTIFARKEGYEPQTISLVIEIKQIQTELTLFLNSIPKNDGDTIQVEFDDTINIVIYYRDNESLQHISGASVTLKGIRNLDEIGNQYSTSITVNDLEQGINSFTIVAQLDNYESQTIRFFVELVEKDTILQLLINGENKTLDAVYNLTIGQSLNVTVKYTEQDGTFIPNATVFLIGKDLSLGLMKHDNLDQYNRIIDTSELGKGTKFLTLTAQKANFKSIAKELTITVNQISAKIRTVSGLAQIEAEIGDDVLLQVYLNDTVFGADITDATVTYNWAYGQGELLDSDNDGIYEYTLENVREGIHSITIIAYAGDNYDFESYTITLVVSRPTVSAGPDLSWLIYVLGGGIVGLVVFFTLYQTHFKYPPMVRKIRKLKKNVKKSKRTKPILVNKRDEIINNELKNQIASVDYEMIQPEQIDKVEKVIKKEGGDD